MIKIAVVTATRAEYGLLAPIIRELRKKEDDSFYVDLVVTGTHLYEEYGMTINEIKERIDYKIPIPVQSTNEEDISSNQAETLIRFTKLFASNCYNAVIILGDRYEIFAVAIAAGNTETPIFHVCGGDTTEGAKDEWIRHSITKMSYLHFVTNELSKRRVIQLGEAPERVFNFGSTSIDNALSIPNVTKEDVLDSIGMKDCKYALCTYHPVTIGNENVEGLIDEFLVAICKCPNLQFIVTKSNSDLGGSRINELLDQAEGEIKNLHVYSSLGVIRYLSLMKYAEFVLGNSSSGIIETPLFKVPCVNIGERQKGRLHAENVINCGETTADIISAIQLAESVEHKRKCESIINPYGTGNAGKRIADKIYDILENDSINLRKTFYDL